MESTLQHGRVVARLCVNAETRGPVWRADLDRDLSPPRIMRLITWVVSQNVLAVQLSSNLCSNFCRLIRIAHGEGASAGQFCQFREQQGSVEFLQRSAVIRRRVKDADSIELR